MAQYKKRQNIEDDQEGGRRYGKRSQKRFLSPNQTRTTTTTTFEVKGELILIVTNYRFNRDNSDSGAGLICTPADCDIGIKYSCDEFTNTPTYNEYNFDGYGLLFSFNTIASLLQNADFEAFCQSAHSRFLEVHAQVGARHQAESIVVRPPIGTVLNASTPTPSESDDFEETHHAASSGFSAGGKKKKPTPHYGRSFASTSSAAAAISLPLPPPSKKTIAAAARKKKSAAVVVVDDDDRDNEEPSTSSANATGRPEFEGGQQQGRRRAQSFFAV